MDMSTLYPAQRGEYPRLITIFQLLFNALNFLVWQDRKQNSWRQPGMNIMSLLIFLLIGAIAGWLAGNLMKGRGFGLVGNIVVGVIGALIGGFVMNTLGIYTGGLIGSIVFAVIGAIILLYLVGFLKKL
jgi:uncharacterized membrane protein YeaQ/YmgE (transglycosylase-associated protein family)